MAVCQKLTPAQIADVARSAGLSGDQVTIATAVALAESGGNTCSNGTKGVDSRGVREDSRGIWQINIAGNPRFKDWDLYDPAVNAQAMFILSHGGTNFNDWTTFTHGTYRGYLPSVQRDATAGAFGDTTNPNSVANLASIQLASFSTNPSTDPTGCAVGWPTLGPVGGGCMIHNQTLWRIKGVSLMAVGVAIGLFGVARMTGFEQSVMSVAKKAAVAAV